MIGNHAVWFGAWDVQRAGRDVRGGVKRSTSTPEIILICVATGNLCAGPPQKMANAVIALDINTGTVKW